MVAILATSNMFFVAALFCFIAGCTYKRDCERVEEYVQQNQLLVENEQWIVCWSMYWYSQ